MINQASHTSLMMIKISFSLMAEKKSGNYVQLWLQRIKHILWIVFLCLLICCRDRCIFVRCKHHCIIPNCLINTLLDSGKFCQLSFIQFCCQIWPMIPKLGFWKWTFSHMYAGWEYSLISGITVYQKFQLLSVIVGENSNKRLSHRYI